MKRIVIPVMVALFVLVAPGQAQDRSNPASTYCDSQSGFVEFSGECSPNDYFIFSGEVGFAVRMNSNSSLEDDTPGIFSRSDNISGTMTVRAPYKGYTNYKLTFTSLPQDYFTFTITSSSLLFNPKNPSQFTIVGTGLVTFSDEDGSYQSGPAYIEGRGSFAADVSSDHMINLRLKMSGGIAGQHPSMMFKAVINATLYPPKGVSGLPVVPLDD
jgi:hypothetical protein